MGGGSTLHNDNPPSLESRNPSTLERAHPSTVLVPYFKSYGFKRGGLYYVLPLVGWSKRATAQSALGLTVGSRLVQTRSVGVVSQSPETLEAGLDGKP